MRAIRVGLCLCVLSLNGLAQNWYRGNLHMHSKWSDGNVMPEEATQWYRDHGYQFIVLSDHHKVQVNTNEWLKVKSSKLEKEKAQKYLERYAASAQQKTEGESTYLRLKTIWELKQMFDQPEGFLMIPGQELNQSINGLQVHVNAINVHDTIAFRYGHTAVETVQRLEQAVRTWGQEHAQPTLFMLNHPTWRYFDVQPEVLINSPQVRFFELCNVDGGNVFAAHALWYSMEKFWDIVNAFRIEDGHEPVFGTATDDTHDYINPQGGARPGEGWVYVRAARLEAESLLQAMYCGDFYASIGVVLEEVAFDEVAGTLKVKVKPEAGVSYQIRFTTTKAGFERTTSTFDDPARDNKPARTGVRYADMIGATALAVEASEAVYTLAPDDLYVRATVTASRKSFKPSHACNKPDFETAWTQPYGWRAWQARNPAKARLESPK